MSRPWFPKRYADTVQRMRVPAGFVLVAAFVVWSDPAVWSLGVGLPVSLAGLVIRAWAAGHLAKNECLARSGPFRYVRNPLYVGTLITALGLSVASRSLGLAGLFAAFFLLVYLPAIELEEQHLRKLFPTYEEYALRVPKLVPGLRAQGPRGRFRWELYVKNREYQAAAGWVLGVAWLAAFVTG